MNAKDAMHHPWIKERSTVHQGETAATAMQKHQDVCDSLQAFSTADEMKKVALEVSEVALTHMDASIRAADSLLGGGIEA